jgi:hypothetical protein
MTNSGSLRIKWCNIAVTLIEQQSKRVMITSTIETTRREPARKQKRPEGLGLPQNEYFKEN